MLLARVQMKAYACVMYEAPYVSTFNEVYAELVPLPRVPSQFGSSPGEDDAPMAMRDGAPENRRRASRRWVAEFLRDKAQDSFTR